MSGPSAPEPFFANPQPPAGPPKKRRTWLILLVSISALMLNGIVGWAAFIGTAGKATNDSITEAASESQKAGDDRNAPREVTPGKAFILGKHKTLAGWKVEPDTAPGWVMFSVSGKVKNVSDATSTAYIHFKFIDSSGEVIGNVSCSSDDMKPGQTQRLTCSSDGNYGKYKKVTAEADF
jgi:hypothetical protein